MSTMTLTTRLSVFFLASLALVLAGFSTTLFVLVRTYLHRQVDERLKSAIDTLSAAVEVGPQGVEWEPNERRLSLGRDGGPDQVRWLVCESHGRVVDRSSNSAGHDFLLDCSWRMLSDPPSFHEESSQGETWRMLQRRVPDFIPSGERDLPLVVGSDDADRRDQVYPALALTAGVSLEPIRLALRNLAVVLCALSLGLWLLAAFLGRWLCRRALAPVSEMAAAARAMGSVERDHRLPVPARGDELEDLGRAFNDLLNRLDESFERQRRFTGDASHQLRTPLTGMLGQIEVSLRRDRSPQEYRQTLELIHGQAGQLRAIVESLLFLARADAEARLPDLEIIDLNAWLREHVARWANHPRFSDLREEYPSCEPIWVRVQTPLLGQLLDNLWDNACKYSEAGAPIAVRLEKGADAVTLVIQDAGRGIAPEDLPHVFEPFYRSPRDRQRGATGIGLGLAVARRIATAFGGTLEVESRFGEQSQFKLALPAGVCADCQ
jgi:two-component system, OmpR family, sensor kinase